MPPRKRGRHNVEAESSSGYTVKPWRRELARNRDALYRNGRSHGWHRFKELYNTLWPSMKALHEAEVARFTAKEALDTGEEGAAARLVRACLHHLQICL